VRIRLELEHAARKVFDVGIIAVIESAKLAHAIVKPATAFAMLAKPGLRDQQRRKVRVAAFAIERETDRPCDGASILLDDRRLIVVERGGPGELELVGRPFGESREIFL